MTVLVISHERAERNMGGSGWSLFNMVQAYERVGIKSYVIMPKRGYAYEYFTQHGVECYVIPYMIGTTPMYPTMKQRVKYIPELVSNYLYNKRACSKIVRMFKDKGIDIVHTNSSVLDIGPAIAEALGAKHVWHLREFLDTYFKRKPVRGWKRFYRLLYNSDGVIAISEALYKHFDCDKCKKAVAKSDAVVDAQTDEIELRSTKKQIMFCAIIGKGKRPELALRIFATFHSTHPDYRMVLVGKFSSDKYKQEIRSLISQLGIESAVELVGYTEDTAKYYQESRVFIMSSLNEAMGRVTLEAMFNGCIVLGYNSGGTAELIEDGATGFLFDDEQEAVRKLTYACDNYKQMDTLRKKAYTFTVENFSIDQYGNFLQEFYGKL